MGDPVLTGGLHRTPTLVKDAPVIDGAAGLPGNASLSVMVTSAVARPTKTWRDVEPETKGAPRVIWKLSRFS